MEIRDYDDSDESAVVALWQLVFNDKEPHNDPAAAIRRKCHHDEGLFLLAVDGGRVVGTVMGGYDGHRGWIYSLAVEPNRRRQGVATEMMQELERRLCDLGCPKVNLQVRATNSEVIALYEKLGYAVEDRVSMGKRFIV
jgi:ribosomal protein S18 acetylase RimI-like enzyme